MSYYYNGAALRGGMSLADVGRYFSGGWDVTAGTPTTEDNAAFEAIAEDMEKWSIPTSATLAMLNQIVAYDSALIRGERGRANTIKATATKGVPALQHLWKVLRSKGHRGFYKYPSKKERAASRARLRSYYEQPTTGWFGCATPGSGYSLRAFDNLGRPSTSKGVERGPRSTWYARKYPNFSFTSSSPAAGTAESPVMID